MNRRTFAITFSTSLAAACGERAAPLTTSIGRSQSMRADLTFITRDGCVNTPAMFNNLDDALRGLGLALDYQVVNLGKLPNTDPRTGYRLPGRSSVRHRYSRQAEAGAELDQ